MIEEWFMSVSVRTKEEKEDPILVVSYSLKNDYARILFLTCMLNGFVNKKANRNKENCAKKLNKHFMEVGYRVITIGE